VQQFARAGGKVKIRLEVRFGGWRLERCFEVVSMDDASAIVHDVTGGGFLDGFGMIWRFCEVVGNVSRV